MKFSALIAGTRAERPIELPRPSGEPWKLAIRPITGAEEARVLSGALEFAKERGSAATREGEPLYDLGIMVHTLAFGCVDVDSPVNARTPAFDGGVDQIQKELGREEIAFLFERQQHWQDECSPTVRSMSTEQMLAEAARIVEAQDDLPFVRLGPALRWNLVRTLGAMLLDSLAAKSPSGSPIEPSGPSSKLTPWTESAKSAVETVAE